MYHVHKGKIYGVLNDFDLSYQMTDEHPTPDQPSSNQRTGTLPFMAIDLLRDNPTVHGYRHDLESFMWVILFHIGQYQDGKSVGTSGPYYKWLLGDYHYKMVLKKYEIIFHRAEPVAQPAFRPLLRWIHDLAYMFVEAWVTESKHKQKFGWNSGKFDIESGGGWITLESVQKIFDDDI
jgi:hypothetical protein